MLGGRQYGIVKFIVIRLIVVHYRYWSYTHSKEVVDMKWEPRYYRSRWTKTHLGCTLKKEESRSSE